MLQRTTVVCALRPRMQVHSGAGFIAHRASNVPKAWTLSSLIPPTPDDDASCFNINYLYFACWSVNLMEISELYCCFKCECGSLLLYLKGLGLVWFLYSIFVCFLLTLYSLASCLFTTWKIQAFLSIKESEGSH